MGYYIRVLATDAKPIEIGDLLACLPAIPDVELTAEPDDEAEWSQLVLRHASGPEIAVVEKNDVIAGELGADEIAEFMDEVSPGKPISAARWLTQYLSRVKTIYAFQLLGGADVDDGWSAIHALQELIWNRRGGILQADGEGFSTEEGKHILWQFADHVSGYWKMALLDSNNRWIPFEMDLGNQEQRTAFLEGRVPEGVKLL